MIGQEGRRLKPGVIVQENKIRKGVYTYSLYIVPYCLCLYEVIRRTVKQGTIIFPPRIILQTDNFGTKNYQKDFDSSLSMKSQNQRSKPLKQETFPNFKLNQMTVAFRRC